MFRMRDRPADIALWAGYFGSLEGERGLRGDLPGLSQLVSSANSKQTLSSKILEFEL